MTNEIKQKNVLHKLRRRLILWHHKKQFFSKTDILLMLSFKFLLECTDAKQS